MRGYKAFNKGWVCKDFQYKLGEIYELPEGQELIMCQSGFHFCENPIDVFGYYEMRDDVLIAEVEALGDILQEGTKFCTNKIRIIKEFTRKQLQALILDGRDNTGENNSGDWNSGNWNSGNRNSGNWNSGNRNSGDWNSGNWNSGNWNSGDWNSGDWNSGNRNSGNRNSGNRNSGNRNSGDWNSGDWNSGDWNSGNWNSGDWNSGNWNSGIFNTNEPKMRAFNKEADITMTEFLNSINYSWWAFCKRIKNKRLLNEDYDRIKELPNFNGEIFEEMTGIKI